MKPNSKTILVTLGTIIVVPLLLVCLAVMLAYVPSVQKWLINEVGSRMEESLGMKVHVDDVRITPFLDTVAEGVVAIDTEGDTILHAKKLTFDVAFWPLVKGRADIDGFVVDDAKVNTKSIASDCNIRGQVGHLAADAHGIEWTRGYIHLDDALLNDADIYVTLTDTAAKDSTKTRWLIDADKARINNSHFVVSLPADTLDVDSTRVPPPVTTKTYTADVNIGCANITNAKLDLFDPAYSFHQLALNDSRAVVTQRTDTFDRLKAPGTHAAPPLDTLCNLANLNTTIDTLSYLADGTLRCHIKDLGFEEKKYDVAIRDISGRLYLDSARVEVPALNFETPNSHITANIGLDWAALNAQDFGKMNVKVDAAISKKDVKDLLNRAVREKYIDAALLKEPTLQPFLTSDVNLKADVHGNLSHIVIDDYSLELPQLLQATGNLDIADNFDSYSGHVKGSVYGGNVDADFKTQLSKETYSVKGNVNRFPITKFVKGLPVTPFSGYIDVKGRGFDPTAKGSRVDGDVRVKRFAYNGYDLSGLSAHANLADGLAHGLVNYSNALGSVKGDIEADIRNGYDATAHLAFEDLRVDKFTGAEMPLSLNTNVDVQASVSKDFKRISAQASIADNFLSTPNRSTQIKDLNLAFTTAPQLTTVNANSGDLRLSASIDGDLDRTTRCANAITKELQHQLEHKAIDQQALRNLFPDATLKLKADNDNPLHNYLRFQGTTIGPLDIDLTANATNGLNGTINVDDINVKGIQFDHVAALVSQDDDGIKLRSTIVNDKDDNPNHYNAKIDADLHATGFDLATLFTDDQGRVGTDLKLNAQMTGGQLNVHLDPDHNIFAYQQFKINADNYASISKTRTVRADVSLVALEGTSLHIYSEPTDETTNDVTLSIADLDLRDLCNVIPTLPRMDGTINGDFHVIEEHSLGDDGVMKTDNISAMGTADLNNFVYDGTPMGNFGAEIIYLPKENGEHYADAFISYEGEDVGECSGVYYDTDGHFAGDVNLRKFPLYMFNAFMDGTDFLLRGYANGQFSLSGTPSAPIMNGTLTFDDAHIYSPVYGVDFRMEDTPLVFQNSRLAFNNYRLQSGSTNLFINGDLNLSNVSNPHIDWTMHADNFEFINTKRQATSLVYGKVLADYRGTIKGCLDNLAIRGQVDILPGTDATYLLTNSPLTVEDRLADLVTFMDFSDTTSVALPPVIEKKSFMDITLGVNINDGAKFHCFLSSNGSSYVDVQGNGDLTLRMAQNGDMRLTGRCTVVEGEMNYELPVVPLKKFSLTPGSYVEFTGDMMNPRLAISATEQTKAVVTENDVQRSINFTVGVDISRTLEDMGLAFTIEAPEDLGIQNKLATMSEEDRYKAAVALLATGMFITDDLASGFKASNALNAFLQNEIQNIAGKALSTFDLSFGMENGMSAAGTLTTDYSFRFSKRFLDDRFAINIGGSLSSGANVTNDAASFIDNVSIEYRLDNGSTRYIRVFYDRNSHDPLEGSMMKAGAGLVLRRKTDRLGELFLFRRKKD